MLLRELAPVPPDSGQTHPLENGAFRHNPRWHLIDLEARLQIRCKQINWQIKGIA